MALFYECMPQCAQKVLDTADIVGEATFHQQRAATVTIKFPRLDRGIKCHSLTAIRPAESSRVSKTGIFELARNSSVAFCDPRKTP
jgi:hypothetical protein